MKCENLELTTLESALRKLKRNYVFLETFFTTCVMNLAGKLSTCVLCNRFYTKILLPYTKHRTWKTESIMKVTKEAPTEIVNFIT